MMPSTSDLQMNNLPDKKPSSPIPASKKIEAEVKKLLEEQLAILTSKKPSEKAIEIAAKLLAIRAAKRL